MRAPIALVASGSVALLSLLIALAFGSAPLTLREVLAGLFDASSGDISNNVANIAHDIVWQLRLPRAFAAFACGGLLALAGVLLQALLRNALADSYILGVSGGASLGALGAITLGFSAMLVNTAALAGALVAIALVFGFTLRGGAGNGNGVWDVYQLLLAGVVLSAGFAALTSLILVIAPGAQVKGMLFWLMGDLSYAESPYVACVLLVVLTAGALALAARLDILGLGVAKAQSLGVNVSALQRMVFFGAALATVAAVMLGGAIGFVGLMTPHAVRLAGITRHHVLLPVSAAAGGAFLVLADTCARSVMAPQQLPVGIFTALIGVPCMLILLGRRT
jgi:iron complex transport system permease protein